jgi:lycopene cyclase domain-containing protein
VGTFACTAFATSLVSFPGLTYLGVHLRWTLPLVVFGLFKRSVPPGLPCVLLVLISPLSCIAWDGFMIDSGVWYTEPSKSIGFFWSVPYEEILFMVLVPVLVGMVGGGGREVSVSVPRFRGRMTPELLLVSGTMGTILSVLAITGGTAESLGTWFYFVWVLGWAMPPLVLQYGLCGDALSLYRATIWKTVCICATYLSLVDRWAIGHRVWIFGSDNCLVCPPLLPGLHVEEVAFFVLTCWICASSYVAIQSVVG